MSHPSNDTLLEHAVKLADEMDERFEDPTYIDTVANLIRESDLETLDAIVRHMERRKRQADIDNLPDVTVW